jgi:hypothetical protein
VGQESSHSRGRDDPNIDETLKVLIRMMFKRTSEILLARGSDDTGRRFNWVILDELPALKKRDGLSDLLLRGRSGGTAMVATIQAYGHVVQYYKDEADGLLGQFFSRGLLHADDVNTAELEQKSTGGFDTTEWLGNQSTSMGPGNTPTTSTGSSEQRVNHPAFSKDDFKKLAPAGPNGLQEIWRSDLGETFIDKDGKRYRIASTWFDVLSREQSFDRLIPPDADTPGFIPRPPEHQHLRPFDRSDYRRLNLTPPFGFMKGMRKCARPPMKSLGFQTDRLVNEIHRDETTRRTPDEADEY